MLYIFKTSSAVGLFYPFTDIEQAIVFEKKIKKWSHAKKSAFIEEKYEDLPNPAKKKKSLMAQIGIQASDH
ncbi:GIY-YIG nuclease family protein [Chryseobacterium gregarium]|uniref:hypothetical protein n=1 Tax=Chryseobacterium gregarium TaxID=456299 RepID=UPI000414A98A|nr:hypothetical protein [Chryseobacterium gregarium]